MRGRSTSHLVAAAASLGACLAGSGPVPAAGQVGAGLDLVGTSSTVSGGDFTDVLARRGVGLHGWLSIPLGRGISLEPGVAYLPRGFDLTGQFDTIRTRLSYLGLPVVVRVPVLGRGHPRWELGVFAGPTVALEVRCTQVLDLFDVSGSRDCIDDDRPDVDLTGRLGLDALWTFASPVRLHARIGADQGLRDLNPDPSITVRTRVFFASLGFSIPAH